VGVNNCSIEEGFNQADVVVIMNEHRDYRNLDIVSLSDKSRDPLIFVD
jgi:UDP-N-acetyl-D-mannosaminuronic acid dehydrogenase